MALPNPNMINFNPIKYKNVKFKPINYNPISYSPIQAAPYNFVDPLSAAGRYNQFNLSAEQQAYETGISRAQELTDIDTQAIMGFAQNMSGLQQGLVDSENRFNQAQRLQAVDFAMPDLRSSLDRKRGRAETYASGRLLSSAEDRAYQVAAQSASADGSFTRGFGDDSVFGRRTSDVLSAQQRLGISQMGEGLLNDWISQGSSLLIDSPLKSSISQRLPSVPGILPSQQAAQQQSNLTNLTTVPLQFGISSEINQQQFSTNLEQGTRQFNAGNTLATDQFNAGNTFAKDQFNSSGNWNQKQFNAGNRMARDQFNSSGEFQESQARFSGYQSNHQIATQAQNRAEDIARQDAHNEAASNAADQNIGANQNAGNSGSAGQIVGGIVSAAVSGFTGGLFKTADIGPVTGSQTLSSIAGSAPSTMAASSQSAPAQVVQGSSGGGGAVTRDAVFAQQGGGGEQAAPMTPSGAPLTYQGSSIPVASSSTDSGASALDISNGYKATGSLVGNLGQAGPSTPQLSSLGRGLANGGTSAAAITSSFQSASTPEAKMQLANQLHTAALGNAPSPESKETVDQIFSQVREHLDTGVGVKGQAAGIAGFVQNYDNYNGPEKARAITNISFSGQDLESTYGIKDLSSESLGKVSIPGTGGKMTMRDAMSLANSGYNVSSLVDNWDDINEVHSAINPTGSLLSVAATARNLGLLDSDTPESIRTKQGTLRQAGANPAGAWGAGAVSFPDSGRKTIEGLGMTVIGKTSDGQSVAVPKESLASTGISKGIVGSGTFANSNQDLSMRSLTIGEGTANIYNSWSTDFIPKQQASMGGSPAVANGLYRVGQTDPNMFGNLIITTLQNQVGKYIGEQALNAVMGEGGAAAVGDASLGLGSGAGAFDASLGASAELGSTTAPGIASSVLPAVGIAAGAYVGAQQIKGVGEMLSGEKSEGASRVANAWTTFGFSEVGRLFGSGKNKAQIARDGLRSGAQDLGLADKDFNVTLASGKSYNIGVDGHEGRREWHDPSKRRPDQQNVKELNAYDVDYTKDIDGVMNVSGNALSMLMYGNGDDPAVHQMGNQFTNAAVSDVGTAELTKESYATSQANMRGFYQKAGMETKEEAYALSNQMLSEGRITQVQAVQIQQGINLAFDDNGFQAANQLLEGVKLGRQGNDITPSKKPTDSPIVPQTPETKKPIITKPIVTLPGTPKGDMSTVLEGVSKIPKDQIDPGMELTDPLKIQEVTRGA